MHMKTNIYKNILVLQK